MGYSEEEVAGRCAAILANGKRCPNASLPGSRYCGLPAHQALEDTDTDYLVPPEDQGENGAGGEPTDEPADDEPSAEELVEDADALEVEAEVEDEPAAQEVLDEEDAAEVDPLDEEPEAEEELAEEEPDADEEEPAEDEPGEAEPVAETAAEAQLEEEES